MTPRELNAIVKSLHAELLTAAGELSTSYERILRRAGRRMARATKSKGLTAAAVPPNEDEVISADALAADVSRQTERERRDMLRRLAAAVEAHDVAWDVHGVFTDELLAKIGAHASFATEESLRGIYRDVIKQSAEEGWSITRTATAITERVDGVAASQATALARTDVIGLTNGASYGMAQDAFQGREDITKVWLATEDERTRETHSDANGQEVPLNDYFDVGGSSMLYPGDPDGPDEEVINCRCTVVYSGGGGGAQEAEAEAVVASVRLEAYPGADMEVPVDTNLVASTVTVTIADDEAQQQAQDMAWEGVLAIEGYATSDRRYLLPGEIGNRDLPLPMNVQLQTGDGHDGAANAGAIENIEHIPAAEFNKAGFDLGDLPEQAVVIWATGHFDASPDGQEAVRMVENGYGVSIDLPTTRTALIDPETYDEVDPSSLDTEDLLGLMFGGGNYLRGMAGSIGGATLVNVAAFDNSRVALVADADGTLRMQGEFNSLLRIVREPVVLASAAPLAPPRDWFFMDEPDEPTPITIDADGRVYGHLALWNTCHAGKVNGAYSSCMYAPHSPSSYAQFHLGAMLCDDGSEVPIGRMTVNTRHAPIHYSAARARRHYDDTGHVAAFVRAKDGVFGIWLSGVVRSDASDEQIRDLRACPPSGDWRGVDGVLELQAALAVNVPGYVVPRGQLALAASADSMEMNALILGPVTDEDRAEALRAEYDMASEEGVDLLIELGVGEFCGIELAAIGRVDFRDYSPQERRRMARNGQALPDGSFPIANCTDAENAIHAQGRGSASQGRVVSHIRKRVKALGCTGTIFDPYK